MKVISALLVIGLVLLPVLTAQSENKCADCDQFQSLESMVDTLSDSIQDLNDKVNYMYIDILIVCLILFSDTQLSEFGPGPSRVVRDTD